MPIEDELKTLKIQIEEADKNLNIQIGREAEILKRLQEEEGFKSEGQAENYVAREKGNLLKMDEEIDKKFKFLKENYTW